MDRIRTYQEFWPFYLREHSKPWTVRLHVLGTVLSLALAAYLFWSGRGWWTLSALVVGYAFAWFSHFFVEHNRPATFKYPLWSFVSDFRMAALYLTGRLKQPISRLETRKKAAVATPLEKAVYVLTTLLGSVGNVFGIRTEEQPAYEVLRREQSFELRWYAPFAVVTITHEGPFREAQSASFNALASYIFGDNEKSQPIAMTAPVLQKRENEPIAMTAPVVQKPEGDSWRMEFMLPSKYRRLADAPAPKNRRVKLEEVPSETLVAYRFTGRVDEAKREAIERAIRAWVSGTLDLVVDGEPRLALCDPPFTIPFLRRNEILVPVRSKSTPP